ncbi:hypothetical protein, partial [Coleofasciculus sp. FACHB-712]|uniref:hypothetical protein n=1 Tax=Coleofasciculus sp. FACHB-712 TaxID=2692789 RepID=UPI001A7E6BB9
MVNSAILWDCEILAGSLANPEMPNRRLFYTRHPFPDAVQLPSKSSILDRVRNTRQVNYASISVLRDRSHALSRSES